jgi:ribonuclease-3
MKDDRNREFLEKLGCEFRKRELLRQALTHSSTGAAVNYERLEFLGDRVLGLVMAQILYETFPQEDEGDLAKRHAALVQGDMLAGIAAALGLGQAMEFSSAERAAGGSRNENILADALEAVIGALYLDAGLPACRKCIERLWGDNIKTMKEPPQDAKTALQEWAQERGLKLPLYEQMSRQGPDHAPEFEIRVTVEGFQPVRARGPSRRTAEKEAARLLLQTVKKEAK